MGKTKLYAICKEHFQLTPMQLVTYRRMQAAMDLLLNTTEPVKYVARAVGVPDENYFTKVFRAQTGDTPTAFRRRNSAGGEALTDLLHR